MTQAPQSFREAAIPTLSEQDRCKDTQLNNVGHGVGRGTGMAHLMMEMKEGIFH